MSSSPAITTRVIYIFFRDLRLIDNPAWNHCCTRYRTVYPVFLYDQSEWPSSTQRQFLSECLDDLRARLRGKLWVTTFPAFRRRAREMFGTAIKDLTIVWNTNYENPGRYQTLQTTRFAHVIEFDDALMIPMSRYCHTRKNQPYRKFTPFYRYMTRTFEVPRPDLKERMPPRLASMNEHSTVVITFRPNHEVYVRGGYQNAVDRLRAFVQSNDGLRGYATRRNLFSYPTSYLSAYLSLNVISIRQVYHATRSSEAFVRELYWREFYLHVVHFFPERVFRIPAARVSSSSLLSDQQHRAWERWKTGRTGVDLVDACMTQLNTTGFMHNRGRMIVASYLVKNMRIPFEYGEKYFESRLIDYNKASNNGGWQWVNGTGVDAQPRYQVFNPEIQRQKYDPDRAYCDLWLARR